MQDVLISERVAALRVANDDIAFTIFRGDAMDLLRSIPDDSLDLIVSSPPYCMGKAYETAKSVKEFRVAHELILPEIARVIKPGGSICWQVGYHVTDGKVTPLDFVVHSIMHGIDQIVLRNRIVWTFGHGLHHQRRFSGRHETVLWYTKGADYHFDLDAVRVPQKYPGKTHYKGEKKGQPSGNPKGKNPSDIWEIPNVKANHVEKTKHPCQFPVGLVDRLVRALCPADGVVCDPFMGSGSTGVAALLNDRRFVGAEISPKYVKIALERLRAAQSGNLKFRSADLPICVVPSTRKVARAPDNFVRAGSV